MYWPICGCWRRGWPAACPCAVDHGQARPWGGYCGMPASHFSYEWVVFKTLHSVGGACEGSLAAVVPGKIVYVYAWCVCV
jgi:hypothetical protein